MPRRGEDGDTSGEGTSWIVLRHTPVEGLGLLANALRDFGVHHRYLDVARGDALPKDVRAVGGVIVLGGPMGAYETESHPFLKTESALVEKAMAAGRPVLGVCLGAQLIAQVLGARVYPGERREVGWAPVQLTDDGRDDPLFAGLDDSPPSSTSMVTPTSCRPTRPTSRARRCTSSRRSAGATPCTGSSSISSSPSPSSHVC
jgi:GMP synthase-like glutamine amidotransferase